MAPGSSPRSSRTSRMMAARRRDKTAFNPAGPWRSACPITLARGRVIRSTAVTISGNRASDSGVRVVDPTSKYRMNAAGGSGSAAIAEENRASTVASSADTVSPGVWASSRTRGGFAGGVQHDAAGLIDDFDGADATVGTGQKDEDVAFDLCTRVVKTRHEAAPAVVDIALLMVFLGLLDPAVEEGLRPRRVDRREDASTPRQNRNQLYPGRLQGWDRVRRQLPVFDPIRDHGLAAGDASRPSQKPVDVAPVFFFLLADREIDIGVDQRLVEGIRTRVERTHRAVVPSRRYRPTERPWRRSRSTARPTKGTAVLLHAFRRLSLASAWEPAPS